MNILTARALFKKTTLYATAFVLAVSTLTAAVPIILSKTANAIAPAVQISEASFVKSANPEYTGIYVGAEISQVNTAKALEVKVNRTDGSTYSIHATQSLLDKINTSVTDPYSLGGTVIVTGSRPSSSWTNQTGTWTGLSRPAATNPVEVVITLEDATVISAAAPIITGNGATSAEVFASVSSVPGVAEVNTKQQLKAALANPAVYRINLTGNITTDESFVLNRSNVMINGNHYAITGPNLGGTWVSSGNNFALKIYRASGVGINSLTITGANAGIQVNGSEVSLSGHNDLSGNVFGGIELTKGSGVTETPVLNLTHDGGSFTYRTEQTGAPAVWSTASDAVVNASAVPLTKATHIVDGQSQYYTVASNANIAATNTTRNTTFATLEEAITAATTGDKIELNKNITLTKMVFINKGLTVDGKGYTVTAPYSRTQDGLDNAVLTINGDNVTLKNVTTANTSTNVKPHGVVVHNARGVVLENLTLKGGRAGVTIVGSGVTAKNIHTEGNAWGGINVDAGTTNGSLVISGSNTHNDPGVPALWVDNRPNTSIVDTDNQYVKQATGVKDFYYLDQTAPVVTVNSPIDGSYSKAPVQVNATITDNNLRHYFYQVTRNGSVIKEEVVLSSGITNKVIYTTTQDGVYTVVVAARDKAGSGDSTGHKTTAQLVTFTVDSVAPEKPTLATPGNNAYLKTNDFYFNWDDVAGASSYEIQASQSSNTNQDGSLTSDVWRGDYQGVQPTQSTARSVGASGTWYWQVRSVDTTGNKSGWTTPWAISFDTIAPSISGTPSTTSPTKSTNNTWAWDAATDATSGIKGYEYQINDGIWTFVDGTTVTTDAPVANGSYTFSVRAIDNADNTGPVSTGTVSINTSVISTINKDEIDTTVSNPTITGQIVYDVDKTTPVVGQTVRVEVGSGLYTDTTDINGEWTIVAQGLEDGEHIVKVNDAVVRFTTKLPVVEEVVTTAPVVTTAEPTTPIPLASPTVPTIINPSTFAGVLGTTTDNATNDDGAAVEGTSTKNTLAVAANSDANRGAFLGLNWYWWLLIVAAVAGTAWWIFGAIRNRQFEN